MKKISDLQILLLFYKLIVKELTQYITSTGTLNEIFFFFNGNKQQNLRIYSCESSCEIF